MAGAASAVAIVAGLVIRPGKMEQWIKQSGLLQSQKNRVGAQQRSKSSFAQFYVRPPRPLIQLRNSDFGFLLPSALENPEYVAGLRNLPPLDRLQERQDTF